jgi:hypothetical protein
MASFLQNCGRHESYLVHLISTLVGRRTVRFGVKGLALRHAFATYFVAKSGHDLFIFIEVTHMR